LPVLPDLASFLDELSRDVRTSAVMQTAGLVQDTFMGLFRSDRLEGWPDTPATEVLAAWLRDPARLVYLEAAFERLIDAPEADEIAYAIDGLHWLHPG
jgi:hypothetical protein